MTLDEAIRHAEEVANKKDREKQKWERWLENDSDYRAVAEKVNCELCAEEHKQLAEWLKELKEHRKAWLSVENAIERAINNRNMCGEDNELLEWVSHIIDNVLGEVGK